MAGRVGSHVLLARFLASGHLCSCLYNSSAWRARIKNTMFSPLPDCCLASCYICLVGNTGWRLSGWGGNWIQMLCFLGKCFKYLVVTQKKKGEPVHPVQGKRWTARLLWWCSPQWVCWCEMFVPGIRRNMGYQVFFRSPFSFGPLPWRGHFIAGYMEVSQQGMVPASGRKMWGKRCKLWKWVIPIQNYVSVQYSSWMVE